MVLYLPFWCCLFLISNVNYHSILNLLLFKAIKTPYQMKKLLLLFAGLLFMVSITFAQCGWSGHSGAADIDPNGSCNVDNNRSVGSGTYTYCYMNAGWSYGISSCGSAYDNQLTVYDQNPAWTARAYDDDNGPWCSGTNASINYTPTWTGWHIIINNNYNCQQHVSGASSILKVRVNSVPTPTNGTMTLNGTNGNIVVCPGGNIAVAQTTPNTQGGNYYYWIGTDNGSGWVNSWDYVSQGYANTASFNYSFANPGKYVIHTNAINLCGTSGPGVTHLVTVRDNNPGSITPATPTSMCQNGSASILNQTAATSNGGGTPTYYYYWQRTSAPAVGWTMYQSTTALSSALPTAVTGTVGTYLLARNSDFGCGQANNGTTVNIAFTVNPAAPAAPTANAGTSAACSSFTANWSASSNGTAYYLDVSTVSNFASFVSGYNNLNVGNVTTRSVTGLTAGTTYYYRVRAGNSCGTSGNSGTITYATSPATPAAPVAAAGSAAACTSISANWAASSNGTAYYLDVSTVSNFASFVSGYNNLNVGNVTTRSVTGLTAGTTYYYRVRAGNSCGTSGNSGTITYATLAATPAVPGTAAGSNAACTSISANWAASSNGTAYYLDVSTVSNFASFVSGYNNLNVGNVTTRSVTGLTAGTTYYYRVRAGNSCGTSASNATITYATLPAAPAAPATAAGSGATCTSFNANWAASSNGTTYYLDVSTVSNFASFVGSFNNLNVGNVTTYSVTGLTAGTTYYYRVRAGNTCGTSASNATITYATSPAAPAAPVAAAGSASACTSFTANWAASSNGTAYLLDVSTVSNFASFVSGYNNLNVGNVTSASVTGLSAGTTYYYRVRASNTCGTSASSGTITYATSPATPAAPVAAAGSSAACNSFTANWAASSNGTAYLLDVSTVSNFASFVGSYNALNVGNVTSASVTGLTVGVTYYYRVRATNSCGTSTYSGTITYATSPATPAVPGVVAGSGATCTSITANWGASANASTYYLDVSTVSNFASFVSGYNNLSVGNVTTYSVTGLTAGVTYYYRVRASNSCGTSASNATTTYATSAATPAAPATAAGSGATCSSISANWAASGGATSYLLDVSTVSNFASFVGSYNNLNVGNVTTYSVTGLTAGVTYYYRVRATNSCGTSASNATITYATLPATPAAPATAAGTGATCNSINANWVASSNGTAYYLDVSTVSNFASFVGSYNNLNVGNVTTYAVTGLTAGTTYYYRVRASNSCGTSASNATITYATLPATPAAPATAAGSGATCTTIDANWVASSNGTAYYLDVSTVSNFATFVSGFNNLNVGNVTTYNVTGLAAGTTYYYRVRASNSCGTSASNATITYATLPATPPVPAAAAGTAATCTGFTANWGASAGANNYFLDVSTVSNFATFVSGFNNLSVGNVTSYGVTGLTAGNTYYYRVRAANTCGTTASNASTTFATSPATPAVPATAAGSGTTCTTINANWVASANATNYYLDVSTVSNFATFVSGYSNLSVGNVTTYSITGLTAGTTYYYRVRASNSCGTSASNATITYATAPATPAVPTAAAGTNADCNSFTANWVAVANATNYYLDVSTVSNFATFVSGFNNLSVGNVASYSVTGLSTSTTYYYRVRSSNNCGTSASNATTTYATTGLLTPSVTIAASANPICPGTSVTFTATPSNGGAGPLYQWKLNNVNQGSNSATATYTTSSLVNGDAVKVVLTSNAACLTTTTATSNTETMVVITPAAPTLSVTAQPTCAIPSGSISVTSPLGIEYEYSLDGGTYQASTAFSGVASGDHTVTSRLAASPACVSTPSGTVTINDNPTPLTTSPVSVCQGGIGYLVASNVCVDNFVVPTITNSIYGGWLPADPTASTPSGAVNSTTCAFSGAARTYSVVKFQVSATGSYIFEMNDNSTYNGAGYIVTGNFTPGACGTGTLIRIDNDGGIGDEPKLGTAGNPLMLTAGVTYSLVSTTDGASNVVNNDYTWTITPPAGENVMLNEPGTVEWYTASSGGSPIGYGTEFNPVGVPGSGILNTNTAGTTTFWAACSSSPSCRTQADYTITTTAPTFTVTPGTSTCYNAGSPVTIGLSGSVNGFPYQIYKDGSATGMPSATNGSGASISLGSVVDPGVYTVSVHSGSCDIPMDGSVTIKPVPIADAGADVNLPCSNVIGLTGSSNSTTIFTEDFGATTNTQLSPSTSNWRLFYLYGTHPANRTEWWIGYNGGSPYSFSCASTGAALGTVDNRQYQSDVPCDYAWDAGTMDEIAYNVTPVDARLYTSVDVAFDYHAGGNYSAGIVRDYMQVMYSLDNGASWVAVSAGNNVGTYTLNRAMNGATNAFFTLTPGATQSGTAHVNMPAAVIGQKFLLGFRWVNDGDLTGDFVGNMLVDNINITGAASYSWSPTAGVTNSNTATPTVSNADTYTLVVTAGNGCTATDNVVVGPSPGEVVGTIATADQTGYGQALCADGTRDPNNITFSVPASSGSTYMWYYKEVAGATPPAAPVPGSGTSGWTSTGVTTASYNPPAYPIAVAGKSRTYAVYVTSTCSTSDWANGSRKITVDAVFTQNSNLDNCFNIDNVSSNYYVLVNATGGTPGMSGYNWPVSGAVTYGVGNGAISTNTHIYEYPLNWSGTIPVSDELGCVAAGGNSETVYMPSTQPDDIASSTFVGPGTEMAVEDCYDLGFDRWITYYDASEHIIMAINAKDNNLGKVNVAMYRNPDEPVILNSAWSGGACYQSPVRPMERHFVVTTANSPSTWGGTQKVGVRLFFTDTELQDLITETYGVNGSSNWNQCSTDDDVRSLNDLFVTKYTAPSGSLATEDGDYTNNLPAQQGGLYRIFGDNTTPALGNGPLLKDDLGRFNTLYGGVNAHHYVELNVEEFSEFWIHGSAHIEALPVTMLFLEANAINNAYIQIKWATSLEINNSGFQIERSTNGQSWEQVGWVNGHNNTTTQTNYSFDDVNVTTGIVYYYRLKQVDNDGAFEYTDIVSAKLTGEVTFSVKDFIPNPTLDKTRLIITGTKDQEINVAFYNLIGQKVLESNHQVNKGANMIEFDLGKLAAGTYTAIVSSANEVYTKKVVLAK